jgi:NitT/TauT family transport system permease protein
MSQVFEPDAKAQENKLYNTGQNSVGLRPSLTFLNHKFMGWYGIIGFLFIWQLAPMLNIVNSQFIPPVSSILAEALKLLSGGLIFIHAATSLQRVLLGLLAAMVIAIPLGISLAGFLPRFTKFMGPLLQLLGNINAFALFPLFILLFGTGEMAKFAIIFWSSIWPILNTTIYGVQNIDPILLKAARSMGASRLIIFYKVIIPSAAPSIFTGFKMGATTAFLFLIAAEMLAANAGLGWMIHNASVMNVIPRLFVGVVGIAIMGLAFNMLIGRAETYFLSYREKVSVS